jgi:hypothetical protein
MKRDVLAALERVQSPRQELRLSIVEETACSAEEGAYLLPLRNQLGEEAQYDRAAQHREILELCLAMDKRGKAGLR